MVFGSDHVSAVAGLACLGVVAPVQQGLSVFQGGCAEPKRLGGQQSQHTLCQSNRTLSINPRCSPLLQGLALSCIGQQALQRQHQRISLRGRAPTCVQAQHHTGSLQRRDGLLLVVSANQRQRGYTQAAALPQRATAAPHLEITACVEVSQVGQVQKQLGAHAPSCGAQLGQVWISTGAGHVDSAGPLQLAPH